jgi:hypothetical protein
MSLSRPLGRFPLPFGVPVTLLVIGGLALLAGCQGGATPGAGGAASGAGTPTPIASASPTATPFTGPSAVPTGTPVSITSDTVFASVGAAGVEAFTTTGSPITTYAGTTGADEIALDASGNTYVLSSSGFSISVSRYTIGAQAPNATYSPTSPRPQLIFAGPNGTLVVAGASTDANGNPTGVYDFWDPGVTGAPSRTLTYPIETLGLLNGAMATDGTFYLPYSDSTGQVRYDVIAPGAATPARTIVESIAPANTDFSASAMAIGTDGTLYVGEWTYATNDSNAGLYIYPVSGAETHVTTGATNPTGIGLDAAGNVYVANSNATIGPDANLTSDTLHELSQFTAAAASLTNTTSQGLDDPQDLAVDDDGTAYLVDEADADQATSPIEVVPPGATSASTFAATADATNIVLFDGSNVRSTRVRGRGAHASSVRAFRFHRFARRDRR